MTSSADRRDRHCVACGRSIPWDADLCPYCGMDYRIPPLAAMPRTRLSFWWRTSFYAWSCIFPPFGIVIGWAYRKMPDPEFQHVGHNCWILGYIGFAVYIGISVLAFVVVNVL